MAGKTERFHLEVPEPSMVVAARQDLDPPIEPGNPLGETLSVADGKITQVIDRVIRPDSGVPATYQLLVHLLHGGERAVAILDDVGVGK